MKEEVAPSSVRSPPLQYKKNKTRTWVKGGAQAQSFVFYVFLSTPFWGIIHMACVNCIWFSFYSKMDRKIQIIEN